MIQFRAMGKYSWIARELFLIIFAPIFWALLTNFGRLWRYIDDKYYHRAAKKWREDRAKAAQLHWELTHDMEFLEYHIGGKSDESKSNKKSKSEDKKKNGLRNRREGKPHSENNNGDPALEIELPPVQPNSKLLDIEHPAKEDIAKLKQPSESLHGLEIKTEDDSDAEDIDRSSVYEVDDVNQLFKDGNVEDNLISVEKDDIKVQLPPGSDLDQQKVKSQGVKEVHHQWENVWNGKEEILEVIASKIGKTKIKANAQGDEVTALQPEYDSDYINDDY